MAKQGMSRPEWTHTQPRNSVPPVPELQGKAKHAKEKAPPIIAGTSGPELKVYHNRAMGTSSAHARLNSARPLDGAVAESTMPPQPDDEDERSVP